METLKVNKKSIFIVGFKSYYVVWKPGIQKCNKWTTCEFKSYYVVWKPIIRKRK